MSFRDDLHRINRAEFDRICHILGHSVDDVLSLRINKTKAVVVKLDEFGMLVSIEHKVVV